MVVDMTQLGSLMASAMFVWAIFQQWSPEELRNPIDYYFRRLLSFLNPYITINFHEYQRDEYERSKAYMSIERYLSTNSSNKVKRLKANTFKNSKSVFLSMEDNEEVIDKFEGIKIWWSSYKIIPQQQALITYNDGEEKRYYKLTCHRKHRDIITNVYMPHVLEEGDVIAKKNRQPKLYTNSESTRWSHIIFEHPSTFDTLAMHPEKKKEILNDLTTFKNSKDYYKKMGKPWKRGYLLYGPPGTGKSSMIAAMANLLNYDIYDLELTSVNDNRELRKLLISTSNKSIIVIEDIDCSLDLTGQRKHTQGESKGEEKNPVHKKKEKKKKGSELTLSGLLNSIDGLWSACGSERLIVFTTNHIEKLDPALIRRGRMDKHIELSYCCFETFKVLAKNYLDLESHEFFPSISRLLEETNMTPADVAENLMPKSVEDNADSCLKDLIKALENAKEEARLKSTKEDSIDGVLSVSSDKDSPDTDTKTGDSGDEGSKDTDTEFGDEDSSDGEG